jgi:hypothetical protein
MHTSRKRDIMAQKVQVVLIDDIDGGSADETVRLSAPNAARLRNSLAEFIGHGRRTVAARGQRRGRTNDGKSAEIRAWARERGLSVNERGRIPADLAAKFEAAH